MGQSGSPKHQATDALPQPADHTGSARDHVTELRQEKISRAYSQPKKHLFDLLFQHPLAITLSDPRQFSKRVIALLTGQSVLVSFRWFVVVVFR